MPDMPLLARFAPAEPHFLGETVVSSCIRPQPTLRLAKTIRAYIHLSPDSFPSGCTEPRKLPGALRPPGQANLGPALGSLKQAPFLHQRMALIFSGELLGAVPVLGTPVGQLVGSPRKVEAFSQ